MSMLVYSLLILLAVIVLIAIIGLFVSKKFEIECSIEIQKPKAEVYDFVRYLKNHEQFNEWMKMDPKIQTDYTEVDGIVGTVLKWKSDHKNVGKGEQEIKTLIPVEKIEHELRFMEPRQDVAKAVMYLTEINSETTLLTWGFYSKMTYPMNIMKPLFKMMMKKFNLKGLQTLKAILEK